MAGGTKKDFKRDRRQQALARTMKAVPELARAHAAAEASADRAARAKMREAFVIDGRATAGADRDPQGGYGSPDAVAGAADLRRAAAARKAELAAKGRR